MGVRRHRDTLKISSILPCGQCGRTIVGFVSAYTTPNRRVIFALDLHGPQMAIVPDLDSCFFCGEHLECVHGEMPGWE